jgi:hypothetical protein
MAASTAANTQSLVNGDKSAETGLEKPGAGLLAVEFIETPEHRQRGVRQS